MKRGTLALCALAAAMSIIACLCIGPVMVPPGEVLGAIWSSLFGAGGTALEDVIAVQARLPRVILGFAIGCALALAGAALQGLVRNRLADRAGASRKRLRGNEHRRLPQQGHRYP